MNTYWQDDRAAVSINAVCALAGVYRPSRYRDFGREDGLTAAVLERYGEAVLVSVEALPSSPQSYDTQLDALISVTSDDPQREASCPCREDARQQAPLPVRSRKRDWPRWRRTLRRTARDSSPMLLDVVNGAKALRLSDGQLPVRGDRTGDHPARGRQASGSRPCHAGVVHHSAALKGRPTP